MQESPPQTPLRTTRVPQPRRSSTEGIRITTPEAAPPQNGEGNETELRRQLTLMQQQIAALTNQISARPPPAAAAAAPI